MLADKTATHLKSSENLTTSLACQIKLFQVQHNKLLLRIHTQTQPVLACRHCMIYDEV